MMDEQQRLALKAEIEEIIKPPRLKENEITHGMWAEWNNTTHSKAKGELFRSVTDKKMKRRWVKLHNGKWAWAYSRA